LVAIPGVAVLIFFSEPLVRLLFERGAFGPESTLAVARVQQWLLPQLPFYIVVLLGSRVLSAMDGNRAVLAIGAVNLATNVVGNLVLMRWYGVNGIAMATSLVYMLGTILTLIAIRRKIAETERR
jgi:putative peptidoglycan lipid II flippase